MSLFPTALGTVTVAVVKLTAVGSMAKVLTDFILLSFNSLISFIFNFEIVSFLTESNSILETWLFLNFTMDFS